MVLMGKKSKILFERIYDKFSFLLSIPAILGAEILGIKDMIETGASIDAMVEQDRF